MALKLCRIDGGTHLHVPCDPNDRDRNVPDPNDRDQNDLDPECVPIGICYKLHRLCSLGDFAVAISSAL